MPEVLKEHSNVHELYCCLPSRFSEEILEVIRYCEHHFIHFYSMPNVSNYLHHRMHLKVLGDVPYLSLYNEPLSLIENRLIKRTFDVVVSLTFLCTLFPIILAVVAIVTKTTMPGPLFFRQKRTGLNGKEFYCLKFRSMKVNKDADKLQATKNDPRKTKWGNIMRKTNIDELPQFINVLLGQMSIVGPRPHMVKHTNDYSKLQPFTVAEQFTGLKGVMVPIEETIKGFNAILDGEVDDLPEQAFLNVGTIEDAKEKAKQLLAAAQG